MNKLKKIRVLKDLSQFQLRIVTGIHQSKISLIENGMVEPREDEKERLAKALRTNIKAIFPTKRKIEKLNGSTVLTQRETN